MPKSSRTITGMTIKEFAEFSRKTSNVTDRVTRAISGLRPGRRGARRIFEGEAYRRILAGNAPETLSEFAGQLSAWFKDSYPTGPAVSARFIEEAIRDTWHRRHELVGSEL